MKILEVNKFYYLRRGAERHFLDVIELLKKHGHEVGVFAMQHVENNASQYERYFPSFVGYNTSDANLWQILKGLGRIFWSFEARHQMQTLLRDWQPHIVHMHNIYHQLSPSIFGPIKKSGIPIIMTVHDYNLISPDKDAYYPEVGRKYWKFLLLKKYGFFKRLILVAKKYWENAMGFYEKNIDLYIVPSEYVKKSFRSAAIPENKIIVLPHFTLKKQNVPVDGNVLSNPQAIYFGSLSKEKKTNALIDMFEVLKVPLVLAGTREKDFRPQKNCYASLVGQKTGQELDYLIDRATCVVSATALPETFGLIVLEANVRGKPFFGLQSGAYAEIITAGENGYLANDLDELRKYLAEFFAGKHPYASQEIKKRALARFAEDLYIKKFVYLCQALMHAKSEK